MNKFVDKVTELFGTPMRYADVIKRSLYTVNEMIELLTYYKMIETPNLNDEEYDNILMNTPTKRIGEMLRESAVYYKQYIDETKIIDKKTLTSREVK